MKTTLTAAEAAYVPQSYKSFEGALEAFLAEQCPQIGGSYDTAGIGAGYKHYGRKVLS